MGDLWLKLLDKGLPAGETFTLNLRMESGVSFLVEPVLTVGVRLLVEPTYPEWLL